MPCCDVSSFGKMVAQALLLRLRLLQRALVIRIQRVSRSCCVILCRARHGHGESRRIVVEEAYHPTVTKEWRQGTLLVCVLEDTQLHFILSEFANSSASILSCLFVFSFLDEIKMNKQVALVIGMIPVTMIREYRFPFRSSTKTAKAHLPHH